MGYRTTPKLPLIQKSPDNSGLYLDLYTEAARRIGYRLEVVRYPKKRILRMLEEGTVDFYPVFVFSEERSRYTYFFESGLTDRNVAITRKGHPEIDSFDDLIQLKFLQPLGNVNYLENADVTPLKVFKVPEADVKRIISMLQLGHGDVTIYQENTVRYYLKEANITDMTIHPNLLPELIQLPLGFSRVSPHFKSSVNPDYISNQPVAIDNFPVEISPDCGAFKLQEALQEMKADGFTDSLFNHYYLQ